MTLRKCIKCGDSLTVNEKLGLMECVGGRHIEPINTVRAQWWNQCPNKKCGQMGVNDADGEAILQAFNNKKKPILKGKAIVFNINSNQKPIQCKACGLSFTKKGALN